MIGKHTYSISTSRLNVAQGSYIGAPVVYITHLTRENIMSKKKYTPFHSQNENYKHTCTFNLTVFILFNSITIIFKYNSVLIEIQNYIYNDLNKARWYYRIKICLQHF
jgi:hypothetical protein